MEALPNLGTLAVLLIGAGAGRRRRHRRRRPGLHRLPVHPAGPADPRDRLGAGRPAPRAGRVRPGHARARGHGGDALRPGRRGRRGPAAPRLGVRRRSTSPSTGAAAADPARRHLRRPGRLDRGAVVGPTGSGKSTLAGLLVRLVDPADGSVLLDGVDVRSLREGEVSGQAAFVAQGTFLFDDTVRGNITLGGPTLRRRGVGGPARGRRRRLRRRAARGPRHPGRRARRDAVRRAAAAAGAGPGRRAASSAAGAGRRHQRGRPRGRGAHPRRAARAASAPSHRRGRRLPAGHHRPRRRGGLARARPRCWPAAPTSSCSPRCRGTPRSSAPTPRRTRSRHDGAGLRGGSDDAWPPISDSPEGALATLRRGLRMMPEFRRGLPVTFALALVATAGRVVVPIAVQQVIDRGLAGGRPDLGLVTRLVAALRRRRAGHRRRGLPDERPPVPDDGDRAGRPARARVPARARPVGAAPAGRAPGVAGLPRHQRRRPALDLHAVGRGAGPGQRRAARGRHRGHGGLLVAADAAGPRLLRPARRSPSAGSPSAWRRAYGVVRERVGDVLGAVAESVVGASTVRAYGVGARTADRIDAAIDRHYRAQVDAQRTTAAVFVSGEFVAALANAAVVVVGVLLGPGRGHLRGHAGRLPLPRHPVRRAGPDRQRGAQRGAERGRRLPPRARRASTPSPTSATRPSLDPAGSTELPAGAAGRPLRARDLPLLARARARRCRTST